MATALKVQFLTKNNSKLYTNYILGYNLNAIEMYPENKDQEITMKNLLLHLNFVCWKSLEFDFIKKQILIIILFLFAAVSSNAQPHIENETLSASQDSARTSEGSHSAQSQEELGIPLSDYARGMYVIMINGTLRVTRNKYVFLKNKCRASGSCHLIRSSSSFPTIEFFNHGKRT
jgi:hypothetical protein